MSNDALELMRAWEAYVQSAPTWDWSTVPVDVLLAIGQLKLSIRHGRRNDIGYWAVRTALYLRYMTLPWPLSAALRAITARILADAQKQ